MLRSATIALAVGLLAAACGSPVSSEPPASAPGSTFVSPSGAPTLSLSPSSATDPEVVAAKQTIESADLSIGETIDTIGGTLRFTRAGEEAARQTLATSTSSNALWAALWVYASSGTDPEPLRPLLANSDSSLRSMAAAQLVALGDAQGFAVLQQALSDDSSLLGAHPPRSVRAYALGILTNYVATEGAPTEPATEDQLSATASEWTAWLTAHAAGLRFDASSGTWALE